MREQAVVLVQAAAVQRAMVPVRVRPHQPARRMNVGVALHHGRGRIQAGKTTFQLRNCGGIGKVGFGKQ